VNEMTSNQAADPKAPRPFDRRWLARAVIAVAQLMTASHATIVNIALPSAQRSLAFDDNAQAILPSLGVAVMAEDGSLLPRRRGGGKWSAVQAGVAHTPLNPFARQENSPPRPDVEELASRPAGDRTW
jgi:hypothetical protein